MKAVVVHKANDLRVDEVEDPIVNPGEVLVRMEYGGICGSDVAYWKTGKSGTCTMRDPLILGHEVAGTIVQLGPGTETSGLQTGQKVTVHPATLVGENLIPDCLAGRDNLHPVVRYFGSAAHTPHEQGGFSEYRTIRADQIRLLPAGVTTKMAALAEPLGVAFHAVSRAKVKDAKVLVNGAGPIGALLVGAAKYRGAGEIWVSDIAQSPLQVAKAMGANHLIDRSQNEPLPEDVDVIFEASGVAQTLGDLFLAVRRGGRIVQVGNMVLEPRPVVLGQLVTREIEYIGSFRFIDEITDALEAMANGLDISPVMTHEFPIDQALEAFQVAADRSTGSSKVLLKLS